MAATSEMIDIALDVKPNAACIVPERREEVPRKAGLPLPVARPACPVCAHPDAGIRLSLFIEASEVEIPRGGHGR